MGREQERKEMTGSWRKAERGLELVKIRIKEGGIENKSDMTELHKRQGLDKRENSAGRGGDDAQHVEDRKRSRENMSARGLARDLDHQRFFQLVLWCIA